MGFLDWYDSKLVGSPHVSFWPEADLLEEVDHADEKFLWFKVHDAFRSVKSTSNS